MIKTYIFLIGAIFCEVAGQCYFQFSELHKTYTDFTLSVFYLRHLPVNFCGIKLPIAIVYATWSGLGILL